MPAAKDVGPITIEEIKAEQRRLVCPHAVMKDKAVVGEEGRTWTPNDSNGLKLRIGAAAYCEYQGHCAYNAKIDTIKETHWYPETKQDIWEFSHSCIQCIVLQAIDRMHLPLSCALHGSKPNEVIHANFLYMSVAN